MPPSASRRPVWISSRGGKRNRLPESGPCAHANSRSSPASSSRYPPGALDLAHAPGQVVDRRRCGPARSRRRGRSGRSARSRARPAGRAGRRTRCGPGTSRRGPPPRPTSCPKTDPPAATNGRCPTGPPSYASDDARRTLDRPLRAQHGRELPASRMTGPATFSLFVRDLPEDPRVPRGGRAPGLPRPPRVVRLRRRGPALPGAARVRRARRSRRSARSASPATSGRSPRAGSSSRTSRSWRSPRRSPEAQLVETFLLNQITLQTTIASKAARYRARGRRPRPRRLLAPANARRSRRRWRSRAPSAIVGFVATSNVEAARRARPAGRRDDGAFLHGGLRERGEAFRAFAQDLPHRTTFLVDTYDTVNGVRNAIDDPRARTSASASGSGSTAATSTPARQARALLDDAGLAAGRGSSPAAGSTSSRSPSSFARARPSTRSGSARSIGVSADAPYVDSVYKLVEYDGRPAMKLSAAKVTAPGPKQVWRGMREDDDDVWRFARRTVRRTASRCSVR